MRLGAYGVVVRQDHLVTGDVDQLVVFRVHRTHGQETVLGELVAHGHPHAIGFDGLGLGGVDVTGLVHHVQTVHHRVQRLVTSVLLDGGIDVPLHHLAVQEQRRVGVAAAVEGGMQRAQTDFGLGHDGLLDVVQLAVEPVEHFLQFDHGSGRRQLAGADEVLAVGRGVHAVRVLRHGDAHAQCRLRILVGFDRAIHHRHLGVTDRGGLAVLDGLLDAGDVEEQAGIAFGRHHLGKVHAVLGVVLVACGQLAVKRGGHQVAVAVDAGLPAHIHGLCVHTGEQAVVLGGIFQILALVGHGHVEFLAAEHAGGVVDGGIDRIALVREDAVEALDVRDLGDLVADHVVQAETRQTGIDLVVDPGVLAVVDAILVGGMDVVRVRNRVFERAIGLGAHDSLGFIGQAPADQRIRHKARNAQQLATGRNADHAGIPRVATAPQTVVGIQLAGLDLDRTGTADLVFTAATTAGSCAGTRCTAAGRSLVLVAASQAHGTYCADANGRRRVQKPPTAQTACGTQYLARFLSHDTLLDKVQCRNRTPQPGQHFTYLHNTHDHALATRYKPQSIDVSQAFGHPLRDLATNHSPDRNDVIRMRFICWRWYTRSRYRVNPPQPDPANAASGPES